MKSSKIPTLVNLIANEPHKIGHLFGFDKLTPIHSEWINYLFNSKDHVALQAHRDSYKTTSILVGTIIELLKNPNITILLLRKTDRLAKSLQNAIRDILETKECLNLFRIFYGTDLKTLKSDKWSSEGISISLHTNISVEPNISSIGSGNSITGRHFDLIVIDDIVTRDDRYSNKERENTIEYIQEILNIIKDGGRIIFSGTPWHKADAWEVINKIVKESVKRYSIYDINPPILSKEKIELTRKAMHPSLFAANYELRHINSDMQIYTNPSYVDWHNECYQFVAFLDTAYGSGDLCALSIGGIQRSNKRYLIRGYQWEESIVNLYQKIADILKRYRVSFLVIESNADKGLSAREMQKYFPSVVPRWESQNKHMRITHYLNPKEWSNIDFANDCDNRFLEHILEYVEGYTPDDCADSLAGLVRLFTRKSGIREESLSI